ncbi:trehalose 6-phosphate synthase [Enteropsectra breve]|nr:trehalose 6-phosphate synthase [Enteropsectra breve]
MKLIVTSNRIPITVSKTENGFAYKKGSGGLVTGIDSVGKYIDFKWVGSIGGADFTDKEQKTVEKECRDKHKCIPVFLSTELNDSYYNGFCNAILWPTLHSFPDDVCFTFDEYRSYRETNERFAERILEESEEGDIIWVHDYHLMLLPNILKKKRPSLKIMFFLHTAFPESSNLTQLIYRNEILEGLGACDVIAFHLPEYLINFREATKHLKSGAETRAISIGIDPEMFRSEMQNKETIQRISELKKRYAGKKILLGVDRTDYIKGMPHKMVGFQRYLERNPSAEKDVVLLQIGIPSRLGVKEYSSYVAKISELVTHVNGKFGSIDSTPIHMLFNSVDFSELVALYTVADAILITSVIDGFNLVALEYAACQDENHGVVLLSKFAGASTTLQGSVLFNSNNTEEIADAIETGLSMDASERKERHLLNKRNIDIFTSIKWAEDNLDAIYSGWRDEINNNK